MKKKKLRRKIDNILNKKWFDKECRIKRHELTILANQKHRDPTNSNIRKSYHHALKLYKDTLQIKKNQFHEEKIEELERAAEKDPKDFWKILRTSSDEIETNTNINKNIPSNKDWLSHFQNVHSEHKINKEQKQIVKNLKNNENYKHEFTELDETITDNELHNAAKNIKSKKATYSDKIKNEMIKSSIDILIKGFSKVFNLILNSGIFPTSWCEGLTTPIYKSGNSYDPNNYRGICVSSCLGKFLCSVLNARLMAFSQSKNLIHPSQIGFIPGNNTADHIFTFKTLHDKYIKHENNKKMYACFVDFKKAFDSIWHEELFYKLLQNEIGGNFYDLIKNLYSNTKCAIKLSDHRTPFFSYQRGVRSYPQSNLI